jgi:hypothetical protein
MSTDTFPGAVEGSGPDPLGPSHGSQIQPSPSLINDGSVVAHEGHRYQIKLHPPIGDIVQIEVEALDAAGHKLNYYDEGSAANNPEDIDSCVWLLIWGLADRCWPEHERIERERAEVRLQREINRGLDYSDFDLRR